MCGGHAGRLSVWWMWCYRSTKDLCCPIQQGIQDRISSPWRGLWCICASGCLISANRKGSNGWPQLSADSSIVWAQFSGAGFVLCILGSASPPTRLIWVSQQADLGQNSSAISAWTHQNVFMWISWMLYCPNDVSVKSLKPDNCVYWIPVSYFVFGVVWQGSFCLAWQGVVVCVCVCIYPIPLMHGGIVAG